MNRGSLQNRFALVFVPFLVAVLLAFVPNAFASPLPVAISPTRFEFAANRGDTLSGTLEFWMDRMRVYLFK